MRNENDSWITLEHPGYLGKRKETKYQEWNQNFGQNNWRIAWELRNKLVLDYSGVFFRVYVPGYAEYLQKAPDQAAWLASHASYTYDKDIVTKEQAFDPYYLYENPGFANQFHNVALNIALEHSFGIPFIGEAPIQVREGKPGTDTATWPIGWRWSPGKIPALHPELIPENDLKGWWQKGTIEDLYQKAKVLQIKTSVHQAILEQVERSQGYYD